MLIGILVGTYSSIYIASPTLLWLEQRRQGGAKTAPKARAAAKA
jgi:preprotein translocase subunit SecF